MRRHSALLLASILTCLSQAHAAEQDLTDLDLATLMSMDVKVTSASRREQSAEDAAAAVYVVTREQIRRSGATNLPDVLRLVPGVQVARINSRSWAVTARGFNSRYANKLLVMVDGRSIYTPLFSGVIWEDEGVFLDQIERIEVVRGPGGALWGINAVNGVINIITRKAGTEPGLKLDAGTGSFDTRSGSISYEGRAATLGTVRMYADHREEDSLGRDTEYLERTQIGVRLDRALQDGSFTLQGNLSDNDFGQEPPFPAASLSESSKTGDVSLRWDRSAPGGRVETRAFYRWSDRGAPWSWDDSAASLDVQYSADRIGRHVFTAGGGYSYLHDSLTTPSFALSLTPASMSQQQWSVYAQDEINFFDDAVQVTVGAKLEDLKFTNLAFQPTLRALWHATGTQTVWAAASRAVRTPSRTELHSVIQFGSYGPDGLTLARLVADPGLGAEDLHAYELGWRWRPNRIVSFDVSAYRNDYEHLISGVLLAPEFQSEPIPAMVLPGLSANIGGARVQGLEIVSEWRPASRVRIEALANFMDSGARTVPSAGSIDPKRSYSVRGVFDLPRDVQLDFGWRSVSDLEGYGIEGYDSFNARVSWQMSSSVELAIAVDNLLDREHVEFVDDLRMSPGASIGRTVFGRITWRPGH